MEKVLRVLSLLIVIVLAISGCSVLHVFFNCKPLQLPATSGSYGVGTSEIGLVDTAREESFMQGDSRPFRRVKVRFWYPVDKTGTGKTMDYMDGRSAAFYAAEFKINPLDYAKMITGIQTHAIENAVMAEGRFPVLLFSPGLGASSNAYQTLLEEAASQGYIVAAVDHPFISGIAVFPDGQYQEIDRSMEKLESLKTNFHIVVDDLKFVITKLKAIDNDPGSPFHNKLDVSKLGVFGHSFGGAASVRLSMEEPAIKAGVNLDGWLDEIDYTQGLKTPLLFIAGETYTDSADPNWEVAWRNLASGYRIRIKGTTHLNFCDLGVVMHHFYPRIPLKLFKVRIGKVTHWRLGEIDPGLGVEITNAYTLAFFDHVLKGEASTALEELSVKYKEVKFEAK